MSCARGRHALHTHCVLECMKGYPLPLPFCCLVFAVRVVTVDLRLQGPVAKTANYATKRMRLGATPQKTARIAA